jgi:hypothetical protein
LVRIVTTRRAETVTIRTGDGRNQERRSEDDTDTADNNANASDQMSDDPKQNEHHKILLGDIQTGFDGFNGAEIPICDQRIGEHQQAQRYQRGEGAKTTK